MSETAVGGSPTLDGEQRCSRSPFPTSSSKRLWPPAATRRPWPTSPSCPVPARASPHRCRAIIRASAGYPPLVLLTAAAIVPSIFGYGINLIGNNLEKSFHLHDAGLGAVAFVVSVAQLLWAVPLAVWADRGSRKVVSAVCLPRLRRGGTVHGAGAQRVVVHVLVPVAAVGSAVNLHRAQLVSVRRLSDRRPEPGVQLALPAGPHRPDRSASSSSATSSPGPTTGDGACIGLARGPPR